MPTKAQDDEHEPPAGIGVGARGGGVIDPTKNVLDLVRAEARFQDGMRDALENHREKMLEASEKHNREIREWTEKLRAFELKFQDWMRDAETKRNDQVREAEMKRNDQIRAQAERFETIISGMLSKSVESTQSLVATQLLQIQNTFNERVARLEQWRYERTGSASVSDPALANSLSQLGSSISGMQTTFADTLTRMTNNQTEAMNKMAANINTLQTSGVATTSAGGGQAQMAEWIIRGVLFLVAVAGFVFAVVK